MTAMLTFSKLLGTLNPTRSCQNNYVLISLDIIHFDLYYLINNSEISTEVWKIVERQNLFVSYEIGYRNYNCLVMWNKLKSILLNKRTVFSRAQQWHRTGGTSRGSRENQEKLSG